MWKPLPEWDFEQNGILVCLISLVEAGSVPTLADGAILAIDSSGTVGVVHTYLETV